MSRQQTGLKKPALGGLGRAGVLTCGATDRARTIHATTLARSRYSRQDQTGCYSGALASSRQTLISESP